MTVAEAVLQVLHLQRDAKVLVRALHLAADVVAMRLCGKNVRGRIPGELCRLNAFTRSKEDMPELMPYSHYDGVRGRSFPRPSTS